MDAKRIAESALERLSRQVDVASLDAGQTVRGRRLAPRERAPSPTDALPEVQGDLEAIREIGRGGMGIVELATQRSIGREVAVKRVADPSDREAVRGLIEEARVTGRLEHPNIVPVHTIGKADDGSAVLVMKHVEGVPWSALLHDAEHAMWAQVRGDRRAHHLRVLVQVCRAVELTHARGYLHRDLKPSNVMLGPFGEVYLLDFGLAIHRERVADLPDDYLQGTLQYMAPEMLRPELHAIDERSDVYLLGACLHEILTGKPRHAGARLSAVLFSAARSEPCEHGDDVPRELQAICRRATAAQPSDRWESAAALREAIEDFLAHRESRELTAAAEQRLALLESAMAEAEPDPVRAAALQRECRFGFEQALRGWTANEQAALGLRRTLEHALEHELRQRNATAAAAALGELDPEPEGARARLAALEAELIAERGAAAQLARMRAAFDESVGRRERSIAAWMIGACTLVIAALSMTLWSLGLIVIDRELVLYGTFVVNGVAALAGAIFWRKLTANRFNRLMAVVVGVAALGVMVNRVRAMLLDESLVEMIASDAVLEAACFVIAGAVLRRVFLVGALAFLGVVFASLSWPEQLVPVLAGAGVLTVLSILLARGRAREPLIAMPDE